MTDPHISPISQLLQTLGLTREDLTKRSNEMRQFLTANESMNARVSDLSTGYRSRSSSDLRSSTRSASSSFSMSRSLSRASSHSVRDATPPTTPIKSEHSEGGLPHRTMDSMEIIIERQRQSRRERKSRRERERAAASKAVVPPPSPSPSNTSQSAVSLDSFMQSRDDHAPAGTASETVAPATSGETVEEAPPVTPQKSRYYREHTVLASTPRPDPTCKTETPTPTRSLAQRQPVPPFYPYPPYMAYPQFMPPLFMQPHQSSSAPPVTPHANRTLADPPSPLPSSSPIPALFSSPPPSSPMQTIVNQVSSPGPMEPLPPQDQYEKLPYKLPAGPYSPNKPDLSYAALVGQAILSSQEHRLTLQEIYDWITIVYPHYKRGETTWMNSIRHVLSTTACFRKVPRDRAVGRTLWAIFDDDLECFKGGGFRKHLCRDIVSQQKDKDKKGKSRKRADMEDELPTEIRKPKKPRKDSLAQGRVAASSMRVSVSAPATAPAPIVNTFMVAGPSHPYFPRPTPHHQPYYESCLPQPQPHLLPAEVIFPPLPADAALNRITRPASTSTSGHQGASSSKPSSPPPPIEKTCSVSSASSEPPSSIMSVPELTPNRSSSTSPPSSLPAMSDMDIDRANDKNNEGTKKIFHPNNTVAIAGVDDRASSHTPMVVDDDSIFNSSLLGPVQFWGESPRASGVLQPGIELLNFDAITDSEEDNEETPGNGKRSKLKQGGRKNSAYPPVPTSPTLSLRSKSGNNSGVDPQPLSLKAATIERPKTPVASSSAAPALPATPPQRVQLSSTRTPISHKGLHMSPSASLAHYKSNLDPPKVGSRLEPPPVLFQTGSSKLLASLHLESEPVHHHPGDDHSSSSSSFDPLRTPRKSSASAASSSSSSHLLAAAHPVTPKRSIFDSPFRTPAGFSPFRTPGARAILDPNDPRVLLDEELNRPSLVDDSPGGIFGKGTRLLYDSPGTDPWSSPGKRYWWP